MLQSIKIKNFCSFRDEQEFVVESPKTTTGDRRFLEIPDNKNIALAAVIFGANASGKTNFLRAFPFLRWFIQNSWGNLKSGEPISYLPFLFSKSRELTEFEISVISSKGTRFIYQLGLEPKKVHYENLKFKNRDSRSFSWLFKRSFDIVKLYPKSQFKLADIPKKSLRENASFISTALQSSITIFDEFISSFLITSNVDLFEVIDISNDDDLYLDSLYTNKSLRDMVIKMISKCDTGISSLDIIQEELSEQDKINLFKRIQSQPFLNIDESIFKEGVKSFQVNTIHTINDDKYALPLAFESNGVKQLIPFITKIFTTFASGGIMVFDEIEKGLHPQIVQFILDLFYDEDVNDKHAQLICTSHSADCLNFLSKYQIFLTNKNTAQETSITRLSDYDGVRNDDNFMQKYLSGAYGGVPNVDEI